MITTDSWLSPSTKLSRLLAHGSERLAELTMWCLLSRCLHNRRSKRIYFRIHSPTISWKLIKRLAYNCSLCSGNHNCLGHFKIPDWLWMVNWFIDWLHDNRLAVAAAQHNLHHSVVAVKKACFLRSQAWCQPVLYRLHQWTHRSRIRILWILKTFKNSWIFTEF